MKDNPNISVAAFLRESSKGKLKYDRFWVEEGRTEKILKVGNELTKLHHINPNILLLQQDTVESDTRLPKENDESRVQETPKKTASISKNKEEEDLPTPASSVEMLLMTYEQERNKRVLEKLDRVRNRVEQNTHLNHRWAKQQMEHQKQKMQLEMQKKVNEILLERDREKQEVKERQQKQQENTKTKARRLNDRKKEAEARHRQLEEFHQQKKREQLELSTLIVDIQKEFNSTESQIIACLQSNRENKMLKVDLMERGKKLKEMTGQMNGLLMACTDGELDAETVRLAQNVLHDTKAFLRDIQDDIEQGNMIMAQEQQEKLNEDAKARESMKKQDLPAIETAETNRKIEEKHDATILYQSVSPSAFRDYMQIIEHQKNWEKAFQPLITDTTMKKYRFDLQKAINTPVNAISSLSGMHLRDKVERLCTLLSGQMVVVGDKRVTCTSHPNGLAFCMDLLAKKLITQAENQVPSNHEAAFPLAAVTVSLLIKFPDLKPLLLAHFYKRCPYLVPYYMPQSEGQSQEDHYKALGYLYIDETVEKQDKFLKRMSGIVRFYGAILQTRSMPGISGAHPYGLRFGWTFLARILNLRPRADITATVLYEFLDVAGNALYGAYGKQFRKMLHILCKDYFQEIKKVTPEGSGGPLSRLQDFLQNTIRSGNIAPPSGVLGDRFWNTR